jgi:hypothetical protein
MLQYRRNLRVLRQGQTRHLGEQVKPQKDKRRSNDRATLTLGNSDRAEQDQHHGDANPDRALAKMFRDARYKRRSSNGHRSSEKMREKET